MDLDERPHSSVDDIAPVPASSVAQEDPAVTDFLAHIAHELSTPLSVAKGFAITMRDSMMHMDEAALKQACDAIIRGLTGAEILVQSLAQARTLESGNVHLDLSRLRVGEFVVEIVRDLELIVQPHSTSTVIRSDGAAWFDRLKVTQIVSNLLSNAAKFSPPDAAILIEVTVDQDSFAICVTDRGSGIAPEKMGKLFTKYERLGTDVKGTGLGLYISRGLARAHGGDLTVQSDGRSGCKFCLNLPRDPSASLTGAPGYSGARS